MLKNNYAKNIGSLLLTLGLLYALFRNISFSSLLDVLGSCEPTPLAAFFAMFIPGMLAAGIRWHVFVCGLAGKNQPLALSLSQELGSYCVNIVIPGKLGEFIKGFWLKTPDRPYYPYLIVLTEKVVALVSLILLIGVAGIPQLGSTDSRTSASSITALAIGVACAVICVYLTNGKTPPAWMGRLLATHNDRTVTGMIYEVLSRRRTLVGTALLSALLWVFSIIQFQLLFSAFGTEIPFSSFFFGAALALAAGALPFTIGGLGLREAVFLWYFADSMQAETILTVGLLSLLRTIVPGVLGLPFFFWNNRREVGDAAS